MAGITDAAVAAAALIAKGTAIAVAVIETEAAFTAAKKEWELAKKWYQISEEQIDYYYAYYAPCEKTEIVEACSAKPYEMHKEVTAGRMQAQIQQNYAGRPFKDICGYSRYCTGAVKRAIRDIEFAKATELASAANLASRYEEAMWDAMDDRRWNRRNQALARGRDMMAQAVDFSNFAAGAISDLGNQAATAAMGAIKFLGFGRNRLDTIYPEISENQRPWTPATTYPAPPDDPIVGTSHSPAPRPYVRG